MSTNISNLRKFSWLLKREYWENRGGFFLAPIITGITLFVLTLLGCIAGTVSIHQLKNSDHTLDLSGASMAEATGKLGVILDGSLVFGVGIAGLVLAFVVFFYSLGALYDDRRDRSILFWKSLPVSDWLTVSSKLMWALLLAPLIAVVIGLLIGAGLFAIAAISMQISGVEGIGSIISEANTLKTSLGALSIVPVYAGWALPTVGWLMLCSSFARSKPFLWATLIPMLTAILLSWLGALPGISMPHGMIWYTLVYRGLFSLIPGSWYGDQSFLQKMLASAISGDDTAIRQHLDLSNSYALFGNADMWIGIAIGLMMIGGAIWFRRREDA